MDCMKELMTYSYTLIYKVGEYTSKVRDEELKDILQHHLPYMLQAYNEQVNFQEGENIQHITCKQMWPEFTEMDRETDNEYTGDIGIAICYISHLKRLALKFAQVGSGSCEPRVSFFFGKLFCENESLCL